MPVGIRLSGCSVLVVGGGFVAVRKIRRLLGCHARVSVVAPEVRPEIRSWAAAGKIVWKRRSFGAALLKGRGPALVLACTDSPEVNARVARLAQRQGRWVNRVDAPAESMVHVPSVLRVGPMTVAIFSGGAAPMFVKHLRKRLERFLGPDVAREIRFLSEFRRMLRTRVDSPARRKRILTRLMADGLPTALSRRPAKERRKSLSRLIEERT